MVLILCGRCTERNLLLVPKLESVAKDITEVSRENAIEMAQSEILLLDEIPFLDELPMEFEDDNSYIDVDLLHNE